MEEFIFLLGREAGLTLEAATRVAPGQCFHLDLLNRIVVMGNDVDAAFVPVCAVGHPLGVDEPLVAPREALYPKPALRAEDTVGEEEAWPAAADNYPSFLTPENAQFL